ncbi:MAG TPA: type IV pilus twitching motility protein PilT [Gammaproteobacteria bacterium]|nr:type IV pilus twitching motility protein PilT [Gammaproteobacteria bacterium]
MHLTQLLRHCIQKNASDLHIAPLKPPVLRIDGDLEAMEAWGSLDADTTKQLVRQSMSEAEFHQFETEWELDYAMQLRDGSRFRVNACHHQTGTGAVFRMIPTRVPTWEQLGLPETFKKLLTLQSGLILVTGASGSGKSTTLAAMLDEINRHASLHVITLEDPIEFIHVSQKSVMTQREVHRDTRSFDKALRSAMRQDPDIILLGEMRDPETIRLALTAAETGHLVMATLHTRGASSAISRIVDVFPANEKEMIRHLLAESLQAVICQTLVKAKQGGRVPAFEILLGTPAVRHLIREDKAAQMVSAMQTGGAHGMCTLSQYLQNLVTKQIIDATMTSDCF